MEFQPKRFYRKLDQLLHAIGEGKADRAYFDRLVAHIVESFGEELHIESGRVYVETGKGFRVETDIHSLDPGVRGLVIPKDYRPLELVLANGVFLFDASIEGQDPALETRLGGLNSAVILVDRAEPRRLLAFGLREGWERVHLDFALHTVRNAINHRLGVEHMRTDLEQAVEIQRCLLPSEMPELPGYSVAARMIPATTVGGDFYDFLQPQADASLYVALGDVSGHGLPSALLARDVITGLRMGTDREFKITAILRSLNRVIARSILSTRFVSLFFGELETNGNLFYVNAGHLAPWIFGDRGIRRLTVGGMILGPVAEAPFKRGFAHMDRGDTMVLVTDGVLERLGPDGVEFGNEGLEAVASELIGRPAREVLDAVFLAAERHGGGVPWADDTTVIAITRETAAAPS